MARKIAVDGPGDQFWGTIGGMTAYCCRVGGG